MRLKSVRIQNYRAIKEDEIHFDDYTCLVGPNGAGKSTVLSALNVFFRDSSNPTDVSKLAEEDFHHRNTDDPIEISVTFDQLSEAAEEDLSQYARHGELTVTARATWDPDARQAEVLQYGSRLVIKEFAPYFEAKDDGARVADLQPIYEQIRASFSDLPSATTGKAMEAALRDYEAENPDRCSLAESGDQFYGWSKGSDRLRRHIQWVYVPAVKDASEEESEGRNTALGQLLERSIRANVDFDGPIRELKSRVDAEYQEIIAANRAMLGDLSTSIEARLQEWAHPGAKVDLDWAFDPDRSIVVNTPVAEAEVGDGAFRGKLARAGHGLQRSFIVALLTEVAASEDSHQPTLMLGLEEPELYQHPPQVRHLATVLQQISEREGQVVLTTHSPLLVSGRGFETVRMFRKNAGTGACRCESFGAQELTDVLTEALDAPPAAVSDVLVSVEQVMRPSLSELYFCRLPVLVEGLEDVAFVSAQLHLRDQWRDFHRLGGHFVVCNGKANLSRPAAIARGLSIPAFVVFDGDFKPDSNDEEKHRRDNGCILSLLGYDSSDPWTPDTVWHPDAVMFGRDLQKAVAEDVTVDVWSEARESARDALGVQGSVSKKNGLWVAATVEALWQESISIASLDRLCDALLEHGEAVD